MLDKVIELMYNKRMENTIDKKTIKPSFEELVSLVENLHNPQREEIREVVARIIEKGVLYSHIRKEAAELLNEKRIGIIKQSCL